jgi:hypothetical protein
MKFVRCVAALAAVVTLAGCVAPTAPSRAEMAADVAAMNQIIPILEELEVTGYIVEDGCRWIIYSRGGFVDGDDSCQPGNAVPFDDMARADHQRLTDAIEAAGAPTHRLNEATFEADGELRTAVFLHSAQPFPDQWEYIYDPGNVYPKEDGGPLEAVHTRVDASWWFLNHLDD